MPDRTQAADTARKTTAYGMMTASAVLTALAFYWTYKSLAALERHLLPLEHGIPLGLGLVLIGKALMTAILLGTAVAAARAGERLLMPLIEYLEYVDKTSKQRSAASDEKSVERIIGAIKEAFASNRRDE